MTPQQINDRALFIANTLTHEAGMLECPENVRKQILHAALLIPMQVAELNYLRFLASEGQI